MNDKIYNIIFLCTGNSARSIMAEALLNPLGKRHFRAYSAGSYPTGKVNPFAIEQIILLGYPFGTLRSKSWEEFTRPDAPLMDFIITVCDNAAGEVCPIWPGHPATAHWGFADPAAVAGTDEEKRQALESPMKLCRSRTESVHSVLVVQPSAANSTTTSFSWWLLSGSDPFGSFHSVTVALPVVLKKEEKFAVPNH